MSPNHNLALDYYWQRAMDALKRMPCGGSSSGFAYSADDEGMREASDGDLLDWCDDMRYRVGLPVTGEFCPSISDYIIVRETTADDYDFNEHRAHLIRVAEENSK